MPAPETASGPTPDLLEIVDALLPGADLDHARLGQGQHHHVVLLPGHAAVRISRKSWHADALPARAAKLQAVADAVAAAGAPFLVPHLLTPVTDFGERRAVAVSWVDGEVLPENVGDPERLGGLLSVLRELPVTPELAAVLGGPRSAGERPLWADVLVDEVLPLLPERWRADGAERIAEALALPPVEPRLVHGDLGGGNLLWGRDGRLTGVIDWDLATLFDPAFDAALLAWHGWDNIRRAVDAETYRRAGVWERLFGAGHVAAVLNGRPTPWFADRYAASIERWLDGNGDWRPPGSGA